MPLGEIAAEIVSPILRFFAQIFGELILEILVKGLGYLICRPFSKRVDTDGAIVIVVGLFAWAGIIYAGFLGYEYWLEFWAVDACLDSGGRFDYENQTCDTGS